MKKIALAVVAASLMFASAASAADMAPRYTKAPPPVVAPIFTWTGGYIGVNAGGGWNDRTGDHFCVDPGGIVAGVGCSVTLPGTLKTSGGLAGGQIGYNWQTGMIVWGGEADIQWSGIRGSSAFNLPCCLPGLAGAFAATSSQDLRWFGTVRGRLGVAVAERGLLYGTAGLIYGEEAISFTAVAPGITYAAAASSIRTGWTAGGGFEYAFTNNLTGKIEGLYYDMGRQTISFTSPVTAYTLNDRFKYQGVIARAGLNWKFGGPVVAKY